MKKFKFISVIITLSVSALLLLSACSSSTREVNLSVGPESIGPELLNRTAEILVNRATRFTGASVSVSVKHDESMVSLRIPANDSLDLPAELFSTPGVLGFAPLLSYGELSTMPDGPALMEEWMSAGFLEPAGENKGAAAVELFFTPEQAGQLPALLDSDYSGYGFSLVKGKEAENGKTVVYLLNTAAGSITGERVKTAGCDGNSVLLTFDEEGALQFAAMTSSQIGKRIAIIVDDEVVSAPLVRNEIKGGKAVITGDYKPSEACLLAAILGGGSLPAGVEVK
ncbi:MAG: SecDF P1 head subdomain-containing protein [Bacteroidota bacterium]